MDLLKSWAIARKDLKIIKKRKILLAMLIGFPLIIGVGLPSITEVLIARKGFIASTDSDLISAFGFFFIILSAFIPLYISSYGIIGEKMEKSIEPLLSTPTKDGEILMGKYLGAWIPSLAAVYVGAAIFMILIDLLTYKDFRYYFFPNNSFTILLLVAVPAASTYAITLSVFVSSKVNNVISAYQGGGVTLIPFIILYVMGEIGIVKLYETNNVLYISLALAIIAVIMFFISRETFGREKILTEWK